MSSLIIILLLLAISVAIVVTSIKLIIIIFLSLLAISLWQIGFIGKVLVVGVILLLIIFDKK